MKTFTYNATYGETEELFLTYDKKEKHIQLYTVEGEPYATVTTTCQGKRLNENEVVVKNYSENEGIPERLIELGILTPLYSIRISPWCTVPVCRVEEKIYEYAEK